MDAGPMVHLVSVDHAFHARVIAARLGSDGILTELRGALDGPYPGLGEVRVYVDAADLPVARELLLADQVESAFDHDSEGDRPWRPAPAVVWCAAASAVALATTWVARLA